MRVFNLRTSNDRSELMEGICSRVGEREMLSYDRCRPAADKGVTGGPVQILPTFEQE